jgi:hypothetical protein
MNASDKAILSGCRPEIKASFILSSTSSNLHGTLFLACAATATSAGIGRNLRSSFFLKALCSAGVGRQNASLLQHAPAATPHPTGFAGQFMFPAGFSAAVRWMS